MNLREAALEAIKGVIDGLLYVVLYMFLVPIILGFIIHQAGVEGYLGYLTATYPEGILITYIAIFEALAVASRIFKDKVISPFLKSLNSLLGILVIVYLVNYVMPGGYIRVSLELTAYETVYISIGIYPLILAFLLTISLPLAILPFAEYFLCRST
jgi:hypothetical protein